MNSWTEIKSYTVTKTGRIPDTCLNLLLSSLIKFSIIEKDNARTYRIIDPVLKEYLHLSGHR